MTILDWLVTWFVVAVVVAVILCGVIGSADLYGYDDDDRSDR